MVFQQEIKHFFLNSSEVLSSFLKKIFSFNFYLLSNRLLNITQPSGFANCKRRFFGPIAFITFIYSTKP